MLVFSRRVSKVTFSLVKFYTHRGYRHILLLLGNLKTRSVDVFGPGVFLEMPNKAQEDAVINLKTLQEISRQLGFEWTVLATELGFSRAEIGRFHTRSTEKSQQARLMLESWYERSWDKPNKTKLLQDGLDRAGRRDLAEKLRCLHWGHQKLSKKVELPSAFPFIITVHKTISNQDALRKINDLSRRFT